MNSPNLTAIVAELRDQVTATNLASLKHHASEDFWSTHESQLVGIGSWLLSLGYGHDVLDLLDLAPTPLSLAAVHLRAHALANTGAPAAARDGLHEALEQDPHHTDTLCLLGRAEKDLARRCRDPDVARAHWRRALDHYSHAFRVSADPYPGINQASLALRLLGVEEARTIANEVIEVSMLAGVEDHWGWATLGEAYLIGGDLEQARAAYVKAVSAAEDQLTALGSMIRQAREVMHLCGLAPALMEGVFHQPKVAIFSTGAVGPTSEIRAMIEREDIGVGFSLAADVEQVFFLECLAARGAQTHVVLPMEVNAFRDRYVVPAWQSRFDRVISQATSLTVANDGIEELNEVLLQYAVDVARGLAVLKAKEIGSTVVAVDGRGADAVAGETLLDSNGPPAEQRVMGMIFADIVDYTALNEPALRRFFSHVQPNIAQAVRSVGAEPVVEQSFGDAIYLVYESIHATAEAALALQALFEAGQYVRNDRAPLAVRIGVHAGPLTPVFDSVMNTTSYTGRHTSRTARIEPVSAENQVLVTQQFAALVAIDSPPGYELIYTGERALPKGFGVERLYTMQRARQQSV